MEQCFVLHRIVGVGVHNLEHILHGIAGGQGEDHPCPQSDEHVGAIKVHHPMGISHVLSREFGLHPFSDKIGQHLGFNSPTWPIYDFKREELDGPLCDSPVAYRLLIMSFSGTSKATVIEHS